MIVGRGLTWTRYPELLADGSTYLQELYYCCQDEKALADARERQRREEAEIRLQAQMDGEEKGLFATDDTLYIEVWKVPKDGGAKKAREREKQQRQQSNTYQGQPTAYKAATVPHCKETKSSSGGFFSRLFGSSSSSSTASSPPSKSTTSEKSARESILKRKLPAMSANSHSVSKSSIPESTTQTQQRVSPSAPLLEDIERDLGLQVQDKGKGKMIVDDPVLDEDKLCTVCMDKPVNAVIVPCGHMGICSSCASEVLLCPFCRFDHSFLCFLI